MGCNMCVVQKAEEQPRATLQVVGKEPGRGRGGPRGGGAKEPLVLQVLRRRPAPLPPGGGPPLPPPQPWGGPAAPPPGPPGLVDSGTQTDISFESRLGPARGGGGSPGGGGPPLPLDSAEPLEPERPEELEYEEVELHRASHRDKLGLTVCYRTDGEEDGGIYVGEVNPNSIAAKDGRIREGDRILQINGVEVQDRRAAVALLTRQQQNNVSLLLARPDGQHWKDSDRDDFLDDFGSEEEGEVQRGGAWTPPGQPPSPATPSPCPRGAEPDSGVGRTDESTRNEESSEHDLLGEEGAGGPGPRRARPASASSSGSGSAGRAAAASPGPRAGPGRGFSPGGRERPGPAPAPPGPGFSAGAEAALSPAELRRYRQLRARLGGSPGAAAAAAGAELPLLEEELRHLEFKWRHLLRAHKLERLRQRGLRAWLQQAAAAAGAAPGAEAPLADIAEAPERGWAGADALSSGPAAAESCRGSPLLQLQPPRAPAAQPAPGAAAAAAAAGGKGARRRPGRDRLLKARAIKIREERGGGSSTTEEDARGGGGGPELRPGRYWSREQRKQHLARAREQRRRRELLLQARAGGTESPGPGPGGAGPGEPPGAAGSRRGLRKRSRRILDNWAAIQELLARGGRAAEGGGGGGLENPLLSVTTV